MKRSAVLFTALVVWSLLFPASTVIATPMYLTVFRELYLSRLPHVKVHCGVCHPTRSKRDLNRYGKALAEELGECNVKDRERVRQAMKAIEPMFPGLPPSGD